MSDVEMCELITDLIGRKAIKGVKQFVPSEFRTALSHAERILEKSAAIGVSMVSRYDISYPKAMFNTVSEDGEESIPLFLFYKGDLSITRRKSIAIIGTREPSSEGEIASEYFARALAENGINIVSGLALGCDTAAHKGALEGEGLTTAILGGGLDKVFPSQNTALAERIVNNEGLLLSEYPVGKETDPYTLVARDRLQAALSQAVLVIQTDVNGGTMHAVKSAAASRKPIFAVEYKKNLPGKLIGGNQSLIQRGLAKPVYVSADEISRLLSCLNREEIGLPEGTQLSFF